MTKRKETNTPVDKNTMQKTIATLTTQHPPTPKKTGDELGCAGGINSSCSRIENHSDVPFKSMLISDYGRWEMGF